MAGCGACSPANRTDPRRARVRSTLPDAGGAFFLQAHPDCSEMWSGENHSLYMVGRGTDHERLFLTSQLKEAAQWGRANGNLHLFRVDAVTVCAQAVEDLLHAE